MKPNEKSVNVWIPSELEERFHKFTNRRGQKKPAIIEAISDWVAKREAEVKHE